jgi:Na+/H+ antiporter NhaA
MKKTNSAAFLPIGIGAGIAIGVGLGLALDNLALGISLGVAIGSGLGVALMGAANVKAKKDEEDVDGGPDGGGED